MTKLLPLTLLLAVHGAMAATACQATADGPPPVVVELYTSEGCSSCPPADRWASTLKGRPDVLALAFHVDYWDRLGWADRFASRELTQRQYDWARVHGAGNVYTPQVIANGQDWRRWPALPAAAATATATATSKNTGPVHLTLQRDGDTVTATIGGGSGRLAGYWAVLEDGHVSRVAAGENAGETLRHDHVVRLYQPVPAWTAGTPRTLSLPVLPGVPAHPRRVAFVVSDPATQRPLQALALGC